METSMNEKFYVPDISEFHVGFECELKLHELKNWEKHIFLSTERLEGIEIYLAQEKIRVKYLDREDIESEGFKLQVSSWDRKTLKRMVIEYVPFPQFDGDGLHFEYVIKETFVYQIDWDGSTGIRIVKAIKSNTRKYMYLDLSDEKKFNKDETTPVMEFRVLYEGTCNNKNQLKQILQWTGILKQEQSSHGKKQKK